MLSVITLKKSYVTELLIVILSVVMLNVILPSVIILGVVTLNVVAPVKYLATALTSKYKL